MNEITTVGLDLAKQLFHVMCCDNHGKVVRKKMLKRREAIKFFTQSSTTLFGGYGGLCQCSLLGTST